MARRKRRMTRAEKAGRAEGKATVENIHLMYQGNTARNYLKGLMAILEAEVKRRS